MAYFPSYEIITAPSHGRSYFAEDLRSIREEGVEQVMKVFFRHACAQVDGAETPAQPVGAMGGDFLSLMQDVVDSMCEEAQLDPPAQP